MNFWLLTLQPCRQKWKNGNSLFLCTPKERHFHKSTARKDLSTLGIQKRQVVNSFPLLFNPEFQYLSQRIWGLRDSGDYFLGLIMNSSYFYIATLKQPMSGITFTMLRLCLEWYYKIIIGWYQRGLVIIPTVMTATEPDLGNEQALDWNNLHQFVLLISRECKIGLY